MVLGECQSGHTVRKAHETSLLRLHLLGWKVLLIKKFVAKLKTFDLVQLLKFC